MTRNEMIDKLIKDRVDYYVHAHMTEDLAYLLYLGFEGYEQWTNKELKQAVDDLTEAK